MNSNIVSIIIPTYNRRSLLEVAIESCFEQTYDNIEIVVIDDGSTDGTIEYLKHLGNRIVWQQQENAGPAMARNRGFRKSEGKYIKFLDSDDSLDPNAIKSYVDSLIEHRADLCIGSKKSMSPENRVWPSLVYEAPRGIIDGAFNKFFDLEIRPQQGLWCFSRNVLERHRWNTKLLAREDTDLLGRILLDDLRVCGAPTAIYHQRFHDDARVSATQFSKEVGDSIFLANLELYETIRDKGLLEKFGSSFARSLVRTAVRLWPCDRDLAAKYASLARLCDSNVDLVILDNYPAWQRRLAKSCWSIGGLGLSGRLFAIKAAFGR